MKSLTYVEIDIPAWDQPDSPPNSPVDSPPVLETLRFSTDVDYLPNDIPCIPSLTGVDISPAIISLGQDLGQRATVTARFRDHRHIFNGEAFTSGTFWGKFRARYGLKLRGRDLRVIVGELGLPLANMETRHFIIESTDGPTTDGEFTIIAKDVIKLADGDRSQAPALSNGFLTSDITVAELEIILSPSGIGAEYDTSGYLAIGGSEIVSFTRHDYNDTYTRSLLHFDGADASTTFTDTNAGGSAHTWTAAGNAQLDTAIVKFGTAAGLFDGTGDFITSPDSGDWFPSSTNWTYECWFNCTATGGTARGLFGQCDSARTDSQTSVRCQRTTGNVMQARAVVGATAFTVTGTTQYTNATNTGWHHLAFTRHGDVLRLFLDGVQEGGNVAITGTVNDVAQVFGIGTEGAATTSTWQGSIDEFRLSKLIARWTANFTPPTAAYSDTLTGSDDRIHITARAQFNTEAAAHSDGDRVQLCLQYTADDVADILYDLFATYAGISPSYITLANWQLETSTYLNQVYTALIAEPKAVSELAAELIEQAGLTVWWDDINQQVRLQVLRAIPTTADTYDAEVMLDGSLEVKEQPTTRISQVYTYFAKINPLVNEDQIDNYRSNARTTDAASEFEYGGAAIKKIFSRWIPEGGRAIAEALNDILISRFRDPPRRISFDLLRDSVDTPVFGQGYQIEGWPFQEQDGSAAMVPVQLTRLNPRADVFEIECEEMLFTTAAGASPNDHVVIFDTNTNDVNLRTTHDSLYGTPESGDNVEATIASGITIGSTSTATPAFNVGTWPAGVTVSLTVIGRIQGHGGAGGNGEDQSPQEGFPGGTALYTRQAINLTSTDGEIWGGGGGGAAGDTDGSGGGGGAGTLPGAGGTADLPANGQGQPGTSEAGGAGGTIAPAGKAGGGPGLAGTSSGFAGGAAGAAIDGDSFVTDVGGVGDIRGGQVN